MDLKPYSKHIVDIFRRSELKARTDLLDCEIDNANVVLTECEKQSVVLPGLDEKNVLFFVLWDRLKSSLAAGDWGVVEKQLKMAPQVSNRILESPDDIKSIFHSSLLAAIEQWNYPMVYTLITKIGALKNVPL